MVTFWDELHCTLVKSGDEYLQRFHSLMLIESKEKSHLQA